MAKQTLDYAPKPPAAPSGLTNFTLGGAALALAVVMTVMLSLEKIGSIALPGCGPKSACAMAQSSAWGRVPLGSLELPVSFLGLGYFSGMLAAWALGRGRLTGGLRAFALLAAGVSLLYLGVIISQGHYCPYCITAHIANFIFVAAALRAPKSPTASPIPIAALAALFLATNGGMMAARAGAKQKQDQKQEGELAGSIKEMEARNNQKSSDRVGATLSAQPGATEKKKPWTGPFTGRHLEGPAKAPIRIVIYTDYQCPDCYRVEKDIESVLARRKDVSLSMKHFPFNQECNPSTSITLHGGACFAAKIAEVAGLLQGNEGFWRMHHALFARQGAGDPRAQGAFTSRDEYVQFVQRQGFDITQFDQLMNDPATKATIDGWIASESAEAVALGLFYTPMVFINGVELKGIMAPQAVSRAVDALAATNPPAKGPEDDDPPLAAERYVADWRESPLQNVPEDAMTFAKGPADAKFRVFVIGDYQEPITAELLGELDRLIGKRTDVRFAYRSFPFDRTCNTTLPPNLPAQSIFPHGCEAARAAKAAGKLAGVEGYWKMHDYLWKAKAGKVELSWALAAEAIGISPPALEAAMADPAVAAAVTTDINATRPYIPKGIPTLYVNGRWVPRYKLEGAKILDKIIEEAGK